MDGENFDNLARKLATGTSRRTILKGLLGSVAGGTLALRRGRNAEAAPPGAQFCTNSGQCADPCQYCAATNKDGSGFCIQRPVGDVGRCAAGTCCDQAGQCTANAGCSANNSSCVPLIRDLCGVTGDICCCSDFGDCSCVTLGTDAHCTGCNEACTNGQTCQSSGDGTGAFLCACPGGGMLGTAINCSACGDTCFGGKTCIDGSCQCASGTDCGGICTTLGTDTDCSSCGDACMGGTTCQSGVCACPASAPEACNGNCYAACGEGETRNADTCACDLNSGGQIPCTFEDGSTGFMCDETCCQAGSLCLNGQCATSCTFEDGSTGFGCFGTCCQLGSLCLNGQCTACPWDCFCKSPNFAVC